MRVSQIISRLREPATAAEDLRGRERYKRAALTSIAALGAKVIATVSWAITVRLTLAYLGGERFAVWMTISSLVLMFTFADLGLGNGLMNAIAGCFGRDDRQSAREYIACATVFLSSIAGVLGFLLWRSYAAIPWARILNVHSSAARAETGPALAVLLACFLIGLPLGIVQKVQSGYQLGFSLNLWNAAGSVFGFCGLMFAVHARAGLPWLVLAVSGGPLFANLLNTICFLGWQRPELIPRAGDVARGRAEELIRLGGLFFLLQLAATIGFQSDNLVLAHVLGPGAVTEYSVTGKLFSVIPTMLNFVLVPLWPAYGEAVARGDVGWARRTLRSSIGLGLLFNVPMNVVLVFAAPTVLRWWVGAQVKPSFMLLCGLATFGALQAISGSLSVFMNGINIVRYQVIMATLMALANLTFSIFLTRRIGVSGVVFGSVAAQFFFVFLPAAFYVPRLLRQMEANSAMGGQTAQCLRSSTILYCSDCQSAQTIDSPMKGSATKAGGFPA